ncbi:hypothetical protein NM208_g14035 [Fusarium decemcellulare]|uniref:Uncharacterized protein n=1 Tax=Fusarium decemcellulare TaxID=57161 RepID=A0ACC1RHJ2_9HYPO|nr:hypothetical protein NM208_g14035 [Fusarium decemcellulare]
MGLLSRETESDNIYKKQWLAKHEICQSSLRQNKDKLRELGQAIGIDFNVISTEHLEVFQRKLLTSLEYKLKDLGLIEYYS